MKFVRISQPELEKIRRLYESVMSKASHGLFYREGLDLGRIIVDMASEDSENFLGTASRLIKGRGWVEEITFQNEKVIARGSIEAVGTASEPTCHRLRGIIHMVAEEAYDKKLICMEVLCKSTGDDLCEFNLGETEEVENDRSEDADG
jgi:predicted hydrocarbon binding protein